MQIAFYETVTINNGTTAVEVSAKNPGSRIITIEGEPNEEQNIARDLGAKVCVEALDAHDIIKELSVKDIVVWVSAADLLDAMSESDLNDVREWMKEHDTTE